MFVHPIRDPSDERTIHRWISDRNRSFVRTERRKRGGRNERRGWHPPKPRIDIISCSTRDPVRCVFTCTCFLGPSRTSHRSDARSQRSRARISEPESASKKRNAHVKGSLSFHSLLEARDLRHVRICTCKQSERIVFPLRCQSFCFPDDHHPSAWNSKVWAGRGSEKGVGYPYPPSIRSDEILIPRTLSELISSNYGE